MRQPRPTRDTRHHAWFAELDRALDRIDGATGSIDEF